MKPTIKKTATPTKRGLAPRSLVADEARLSALQSLDRPQPSPAAAFVRAAIDAGRDLTAAASPGPSPAPAPTATPTPPTAASAGDSTAPASAAAVTAGATTATATIAPATPRAERILVRIPIASIDLTRRRFQYRVTRNLTRLQESLLLQGQQVPVILRGSRAPYEIVSGFGRCEAIALASAQGRLPEAFVWADIRANLSDREAHEISVIENEDREGISELDRTAKAKRLQDEGYSIAEICSVLKKGERMVHYYLSLAQAPSLINEALAEGRLRATHALVLSRFAREALGELTPDEVEARLRKLIDRCESGASVAAIRAETSPADAERPPRYIVPHPEGLGFEFKGFHYTPTLPVETRQALFEAVKSVYRTIARGLKIELLTPVELEESEVEGSDTDPGVSMFD